METPRFENIFFYDNNQGVIVPPVFLPTFFDFKRKSGISWINPVTTISNDWYNPWEYDEGFYRKTEGPQFTVKDFVVSRRSRDWHCSIGVTGTCSCTVERGESESGE